MKVVYDGPFDEVEILETGQVAKRGEPLDVADELGKRLVEQGVWTRSGGKQ